MKSIWILPFAAAALSAGCWPHIPGCETKKTQKERDACFVQTTALAALLAPKPARPVESASASPQQSVNFTEESAVTSNDTFVTAQSISLPSSTVVQAVSGRISAEGDVDIYKLSYTSGAAIAFVLDISKPGTWAVCALYTSFGPSASTSNVPDGSMVSAGVISANVTALALDRVSHTHLYIRCSGAAGDLYALRIAYSALN